MPGNHHSMSLWSLLLIPGTVALLGAILFLSGVAETRIVSPPALIVRAATGRRTSPEHAEALVVAEVERLLRSSRS